MTDSKKIRNMEQFAAISGLSRPTVSKFFHDPESVRPSTRQRIEEALERHQYRPNIYAINQNRQLTKTIGIVVPYLADPYFAEIARTLETRCIEAGFSPSLFSSHGKRELENGILDGLRSMKPAGVLLAPLGRASDRRVIEDFCNDVPTVLFDSNIEQVGDAFIGSDNRQFTAIMVDYLCRTGAPPSFFEMKTPPNPNAKRRRLGYIAAMERLGHQPDVHSVDGDGWALEEIGLVEGRKLLEAGLLETSAVLCSNDRLAIGFLSACFDLGMKVGLAPDAAIRVAGMDGHPFSKFTSPPLTTVAHDYEAVADRAFKTLSAFIGDQAPAGGRVEALFEGRLLMRASA
ncbi:MAG: LacI family transcriptional regulator [Phyllobacteriaceae bacterium]|jgi:DNA-binding LacI/PurR family transcriptional regulator|nr:LacI family transcriptional regulator [Phyllobacteriaceae bacterium]